MPPGGPAEVALAITATERVAVRTTVLTGSDSSMVIVGGDFTGTLALGDIRLRSRGGNDGFVAALALPTATVQWVTHLGGPLDDYVRSIAVTPSGMLIVGGEFSMGSLALSSPATQPATQPATIAFLDSSGTPQWSRVLKGSRYASVTAVTALVPRSATPRTSDSPDRVESRTSATDETDDVVIAGYFAGTLTTPGSKPQSGTVAQGSRLEVTSAGGQDLFVARYSKEGQLRWLSRGGGPGAEIARALVTSGTELAIAGSTGNSANFGSHTVKTNSRGTNALIARVSLNGDFIGAVATTQQEQISAQSIVLGRKANYRKANYVAATSAIPVLVQLAGDKLVPIGKLLNQAKVTALTVMTLPFKTGHLKTEPPNTTLVVARVWPTESGQGVAAAITVGILQEQTKTVTLTSSQSIRVSAMAADKQMIVCVGQHIGLLRVGSTSLQSDPGGSGFLAILPVPQ